MLSYTRTMLWKKRNKRHLKQQCIRETLIMILKLIVWKWRFWVRIWKGKWLLENSQFGEFYLKGMGMSFFSSFLIVCYSFSMETLLMWVAFEFCSMSCFIQYTDIVANGQIQEGKYWMFSSSIFIQTLKFRGG